MASTDLMYGHAILSAENVTKTFGNLVAVDHLSFEVYPAEIFGIAGPNGAGKSTLLNLCSGTLAVDSGKVFFDGHLVAGMSPYRLCHIGLARTFQIPQVFTSMSVYENVLTGALFGLRKKARVDCSAKELAELAIDMTGLIPHQELPAGKVDLLTRKRTMLAAALATQPKLVFMDEPLAGLTSEEIDDMVALIQRLKEKLNITLILIEHKVRALAKLSDRIMIAHQGRCICLGTPEKVLRDPLVIEVYLGPEFFA